MNSSNTKYDLERMLIESKLDNLSCEIIELENQISVLSNELRFRRIQKCDLEYRLKEMDGNANRWQGE